MKTIGYGVVAAAFILVGCHTITEELPTQPTTTPASPILTVPIPKIPLPGTPTPSPTATPKPTPTPTPAPTPAPTPTPTPTPTPGTGGCGNPLPPEVTRMNTKIHIKGPNRWTLDTTPLIGPDADYCRKIGFTDGRSFCPVRTEGSADRVACEAYAIGRADDTGRPGPTWYRNGNLCTGGWPDCENHEDNQYLLYAYGNGLYEACTKDDVCGGVQVEK
jgi:hypothetical protein